MAQAIDLKVAPGDNKLLDLAGNSQTEDLIVWDQRFTPAKPDVGKYQRRKAVTVLRTEDLMTNAEKFAKLDLDLFVENYSLHRSWTMFFRPRMQAALAGVSVPVRPLFPGHTLPRHRDDGLDSYRGCLFFEQFVERCLNVRHTADRAFTINRRGGNAAYHWHWKYIDKPRVSVIDLPDTSQAEPEPERILSSLGDDLNIELTARTSIRALELIQRAWNHDAVPEYTDCAIEAVQQIIEKCNNQITSLPLLFELEAFASYVSKFRHGSSIGSGVFANNWLEIGIVSLNDCRLTEICLIDRVIEELFTLPAHAFAPLVVNEYDLVSDGNHRLIAVHLWNILKACPDCNWDLQDDVFQNRVAAVTASEIKCSISVHEALNSLGAMLTDSPRRDRLNLQLKPIMANYDRVSELPYVLLPEYLSGCVLKEPFDHSGLRIACPVSVYELIKESSGVVLPSRASYHFSDRVLLPWFNILPAPNR